MHNIKMSWNNITKDTIRNCFRKCGFKYEESAEICEISESEDEYDEDFLQYADIDKNLSISNEISDSGKVVQHLPSQVSIRPTSEDENSNEDEEPDPPPTSADERKALHTLRRILENQGTEQEMYEQYYSLAKNIESLIIPTKQSMIDQFFIKSACK